MKKADLLSTLFVGIDISSRENVVCAIDFEAQKLLRFSVANNHPGAVLMAEKLQAFLTGNKDINKLIVALESTSFYGIHIANYLSSCELLMPFHTRVYCLNPKMVANYKKSYIDLGKNDEVDAFVIADFARVGRIISSPWRGSQFLALQRLTRHRLHIAASLTREKTYMLSNIFLKFSELSILDDEQKPFSDNYGATASSVLTDFLSTEDIANMPLEALIDHICKKGKNRFVDPCHTASLLQQAARNSYRLDKCLYEPLTIAIASSFNLICAYEAELKSINKAIEKSIKGLNPNAYQSLLSIPGIGPVYAAGIIAEIGSIDAFNSHGALAKYAGLVWRENQSGNFRADDTTLSKAGNSYLRYYLIEAASHVKNLVPQYQDFYRKKYNEVKT
ncbi:MAG: IS110 family transposase, partial [Eubacterium sp.]|nr:IS110 family transposase [Eubacterium sp.]